MEKSFEKYVSYLNSEHNIVMNDAQIEMKKQELLKLSNGDIRTKKLIIDMTISRGEIMFSGE